MKPVGTVAWVSAGDQLMILLRPRHPHAGACVRRGLSLKPQHGNMEREPDL